MAHVAVKLVQGVAVATIHNPPVNGLSLAVRAGLLKALEQARAERADALLLVGGGRTFPAGADIAEFRQPALVAQFPSLNDVLGALDEAELPLVAALHGTALGGGLELALAARWRVGAPSLRVGLPEVHLGLLPGAGGTQRLPRLVGVAAGGRAHGARAHGRRGRGARARRARHAVDDALGAAPTPPRSRPLASRSRARARVRGAERRGRAPRERARRAADSERRSRSSARARARTRPRAFAASSRRRASSRPRKRPRRAGELRGGPFRGGAVFGELFGSPQANGLQHMFFAGARSPTPPPGVALDAAAARALGLARRDRRRRHDGRGHRRRPSSTRACPSRARRDERGRGRGRARARGDELPALVGVPPGG